MKDRFQIFTALFLAVVGSSVLGNPRGGWSTTDMAIGEKDQIMAGWTFKIDDRWFGVHIREKVYLLQEFQKIPREPQFAEILFGYSYYAREPEGFRVRMKAEIFWRYTSIAGIGFSILAVLVMIWILKKRASKNAVVES